MQRQQMDTVAVPGYAGMMMRRTIINRINVLTRWVNRIRAWIRKN